MASDTLNLYKKHLYKIAIILIVGISAVFILNEINAYYQVLELPATFQPIYLIYGLILQLLFFLVVSYAWKYNMLICANKTVSLKSCFSQVSLVFVGKYIPGKIWGMYARSLNLLSHKITYQESILGTYIEQIISIHSGLTLGVLFWFFSIDPTLFYLTLPFALLSIYFAPLMQNYLFSLASKFRKNKNKDNVEIKNFSLDIYSYSKLFILYLLEWVFVGLILISLYFAIFDKPTSISFMFLLMGSSSIAFVVGFFAIFAPGGIGVREGIIVTLLAQHMSVTDSLVLVIAFRLWFTCSDIAAGLLGLLVSNKPNN